MKGKSHPEQERNLSFSFRLPTRIHFGRGRVRDLKNLIGSGVERILVVTDPGVAEKSGALPIILDQLSGRRVTLLKEVEENPSFETVERGANAARESGAELILGIGGGSPMDVAKGIAVRAAGNPEFRKIADGSPLTAEPLPIVCIPTTSGTGSEVTPYVVFTDRAGMNKVGYSHEKIFPLFSIVDPELTFSMPRKLIIDTGLDALTHALEGYLSLLADPLTDALALQSMRMAIEHLPRAADGDRRSMTYLSYASMAAGIVIANAGTILLHIMAYPLTTYHRVHHGRANAVLLERVLSYLKEKSTQPEKVVDVERLFEPAGGAGAFLRKLGVSPDLAAYGVHPDEFPLFAQKTIVKGDIAITPAPVTEDDIIRIYAG